MSVVLSPVWSTIVSKYVHSVLGFISSPLSNFKLSFSSPIHIYLVFSQFIVSPHFSYFSFSFCVINSMSS